MNDEKSYTALYALSSNKKRKSFSDGTLKIIHKQFNWMMVLISEEGAEICRKMVSEELVKKVFDKVESEICFGKYDVQVEEEIVNKENNFKNISKVNRMDSDNKQQEPFKMEKSKASASACKLLKSTKNSFMRKEANLDNVRLDPSLARVMRPHQLEAVEFILKCLKGKERNSEEIVDPDFELEQKSDSIEKYTGVILADEMGLGKTLTSIAVVWAFVKTQNHKAVIVCPSSLVDNWEKEIKKWMNTKVSPICARSGPEADTAVDTFRVGHAARSPVLIISYDMFRKHADTLNTVPNLDVLVCDEAHRLKNSSGTKTTNALSACKAKRRLSLTGTPIQNDLEELYAVVSFTVPDFLGSLNQFRANIQAPILAGAEQTSTERERDRATAVAGQLRQHLSTIMIRRTQAEVLTKFLPPKTVTTVLLKLSDDQQSQYSTVAGEIIGSLGYSEDDDEEARDVDRYGGKPLAMVLPGLQKLRSICNYSQSSADSSDPRLDSLPQSSKLQVLQSLLRQLWAPGLKSPACKVVIVSGFTGTLDVVQRMAEANHWTFLRLDGSVASDSRQSLVNAFNRASDDRRIFLLSAKAGGVGINLIGGSRLIMMDCDWNPAIDKQAMARVWREGQKCAVRIVRLVSFGGIEQSILSRQQDKSRLSVVVEEGDEDAAVEVDTLSASSSKGLPSLRSKRDVQDLLYPPPVAFMSEPATDEWIAEAAALDPELLKVVAGVLVDL